MQTDVLDKHLYADDLAKRMPEQIQGVMDRMPLVFVNSYYNLTISTEMTEVEYQPASGKPYSEPTITVNGQNLHVVDKFTYLESALYRALHIDDEVTVRTTRKPVWYLAGLTQMSGSGMESDLTQN